MMLQVIRKRAGLVLAGLVAALCPMLMAPTGGVSQVQSAFEIIGSRSCTGGDTAGLCVTHTQTGHNKWAVALRPQGGAGNLLGELITCPGNSTDTAFRVDTTAGTTFSIKCDGTVTGLPSSTDSGALTWSFQTANSNCSVNGTNGTILLHKIGNVVTGFISSSGNCTTTATTSVLTTNAPVPAAFRPTVQGCGMLQSIIGGAAAATTICVNSSGNFILSVLTGTATSWTLSGTQAWTYTVD